MPFIHSLPSPVRLQSFDVDPLVVPFLLPATNRLLPTACGPEGSAMADPLLRSSVQVRINALVGTAGVYFRHRDVFVLKEEQARRLGRQIDASVVLVFQHLAGECHQIGERLLGLHQDDATPLPEDIELSLATIRRQMDDCHGATVVLRRYPVVWTFAQQHQRCCATLEETRRIVAGEWLPVEVQKIQDRMARELEREQLEPVAAAGSYSPHGGGAPRRAQPDIVPVSRSANGFDYSEKWAAQRQTARDLLPARIKGTPPI